MPLVDTNVLVDVLQGAPERVDWSIGQLRAQSQIHRLDINPVIRFSSGARGGPSTPSGCPPACPSAHPAPA